MNKAHAKKMLEHLAKAEENPAVILRTGADMKRFRKAARLTLEQNGALWGVPFSTYGNWEGGRSPVPLRVSLEWDTVVLQWWENTKKWALQMNEEYVKPAQERQS